MCYSNVVLKKFHKLLDSSPIQDISINGYPSQKFKDFIASVTLFNRYDGLLVYGDSSVDSFGKRLGSRNNKYSDV